MDHYLEITILPDPEFVPTVLMNALFAKLHRALVTLEMQQVGVSFPALKSPPSSHLGDRLRLHGSAQNLQRLLDTPWLTGMRDHIRLHEPSAIPAQPQYCAVRRVQVDSNPERLRRRLIKRKGISEAAALAAIPDKAAKRLKLPYLSLKSQSTGQAFKLFIDQRTAVESAVEGTFNQYGISHTATLPWF